MRRRISIEISLRAGGHEGGADRKPSEHTKGEKGLSAYSDDMPDNNIPSGILDDTVKADAERLLARLLRIGKEEP